MILLRLRFIREINRLYTLTLYLLSRFQNGVEVFLFHDILENQSDVKNQFSITRQSFESFLLNEIAKGKRPLNFNDLSEIVLGKSKYKEGFIVSFDDCNLSVYSKAYPFLKKHQIPFILFLTVELIGKDNFLNKEQIIEIANDPLCIIGSHGVHHIMFRYLNEQEIINELKDSKQFLQQLTGQSIDCFAFPYGRLVEVSCSNIKSLMSVDYQFAFSAIAGNLTQKWMSGRYFLPRINVSEMLVSKRLINK